MADVTNPRTWWSAIKPDPYTDRIWEERIRQENQRKETTLTDEFRPVRLSCVDGPDLHFDGKILDEYSTQNREGSKSRWQELRLWETPSGRWVAEIVGCSTVGNEREIRRAGVIEAVSGEKAHRGAMEIWGWTPAAKAFSREMGWSAHVQVVK